MAINKINTPKLLGATGSKADALSADIQQCLVKTQDKLIKKAKAAPATLIKKVPLGPLAKLKMPDTKKKPSSLADLAAIDKMPSTTFGTLVQENETITVVSPRPANPRVRLFFSTEDVNTYYKALVNAEGSTTLKYLISEDGGKGIVFPYTPNVSYGETANYETLNLTHSNYKTQVWRNSHPDDIVISDAIFTSQTQYEALYTHAVLHMLSIITKGHVGENSKYKGVAPPVLNFSYLGHRMFQSVPVVVTNFNYTIPNDVDLVPIQISPNETAYVPTKISVNLTLSIQQSTRRQRDFCMEDFIKGTLLTKGYR